MQKVKLTAALLLLITANSAWAVAFCALRDPVSTIYALFPEADAYRSNVRTVGLPARQAVIEQLPVSMHFNELGRHTLYVALKEGQTIGFVHARSESGEWGITEYAWALTPELVVRDVAVQRSRDPAIRRAPIESISKYVKGQNLQALRSSYASSQARDQSIEQSIRLSAMKALIITASVWPEELRPAQGNTQTLHSHITDSAKPISPLFDHEVLDRLKELGLAESPAFHRSTLQGYQIRDHDSNLLVVRTPLDLGDEQRVLWWTLTADGEVISVINEATNAPDQHFAAVVGYAPLSMRDCSSLADLAALELATLSRRYGSG